MGLLKEIHKNRKAISTVNTAIIVAVVAVIVSIAVAGWVLGPGAPAGEEALLIARGSAIVVETSGFNLILENTGTADALVVLVKVGGADIADLKEPATGYPISVKAGEQVTVQGKVTITCAHGAEYETLIYTAAGKVYAGSLYAGP